MSGGISGGLNRARPLETLGLHGPSAFLNLWLVTWTYCAAVVHRPPIDDLVSWLESTDPARSSYATQRLARVADKVAARLIPRLRPSDHLFPQIAQILACSGNEDAWRALRRTYDTIPDRESLSAFLRALSYGRHPNAIPLHLKTLNDQDVSVHKLAWAGLARFPPEKLQPYQRDIRLHVERGLAELECAPHVVRVLARIGHESGPSFFLPFLAAEDERVRAAASDALAGQSDQKVVSGLRSLVGDATRPGGTRLAALEALRRIPDGLTDELLLAALKTDELLVAGARVLDKKSLAELKAIAPQVQQALLAMVRAGKDDWQVLRALAKWRTPAIEKLWRGLITNKARSAYARSFALGQLKATIAEDGELRKAVRSIVADPGENVRVRTSGLRILAGDPDEDGANLLLEACRSEEPSIQKVAAQNLHRLPPSEERKQAYIHILRTTKDRYARRAALWGLAHSKDKEAHRLVLEWLESDERYDDRPFAPQLRKALERVMKEDGTGDASPGERTRGNGDE